MRTSADAACTNAGTAVVGCGRGGRRRGRDSGGCASRLPGLAAAGAVCRVRGGDGGGVALPSELLSSERLSSSSRTSERRRTALLERGDTGCRLFASARVTPKFGCGHGGEG